MVRISGHGDAHLNLKVIDFCILLPQLSLPSAHLIIDLEVMPYEIKNVLM